MQESSNATTPTARAEWVSQRAVAWVLDEAPVPAELLGTLVAIARRCDENGRGSYQSKPTLAKKTGKSRDQVDNDVKRLLALGLIRLGDQSLPARNGVPAGQRAVVYDVALELSGPKPTRASKNASGKRKPPPAELTPGMDAGGGLGAGGGMDAGGSPGMEAGGTPGMEAPRTPGMEAPQTTHGNNPDKKTTNNPSLCAASSARSPAVGSGPGETGGRKPLDQQARDEGWRLLHQVRGYPPAEAEYLVDTLTARHRILSPQWWRTAHGNGSLDDRIADVVAEYQATHALTVQPAA